MTELEAKLHDAKGEREKELRTAEKGVATAKSKMEDASKKMKEQQQVSQECSQDYSLYNRSVRSVVFTTGQSGV